VRIGFKYPPIERGIDINIVAGLFWGVKKIYANGEPATLIDKRRGQYSYYDPNLNRERIIAVVVNVLDYPQFYIDGKEYELFPKIPAFFKWLIFLPVIYSMMFNLEVAIFAFFLALINIALNLSLIKILRNNVLRVIFVVMMTAAGGLLTYVFINVFYEISVDLGIITPSSSTAAMLFNYLKFLFYC
jgi:hypothetical protein